ncbi:MAG: GIY-YIG nuclease family protein [Bacteroidales bacterium]|nr:GIY-YIG nuclease family protein [Bacteroidales bacterium]
MYIMYSFRCNKSYVGVTSNLIERFRSHNVLGKGWTMKHRPWVVVHVEFFDSKEEATRRENYFKRGSGHYLKREIIDNYLRMSGSYSSQ